MRNVFVEELDIFERTIVPYIEEYPDIFGAHSTLQNIDFGAVKWRHLCGGAVLIRSQSVRSKFKRCENVFLLRWK